MSKRLTTQEFIEKSKQVHGDKYNYSKVNYVNAQSKVTIICPIHGEFEQRASHHLNGHGCKKCADLITGKANVSNLETFIARSRVIHNNEYDYSKSIYRNARTKLEIICPKHGSFWQTPQCHGHGCPICGNEKTNNYNKTTLEEFVERAREIHENKYDYSEVKFNILTDYITIICPIHGRFTQRATNHLQGSGCQMCRSSRGEIYISQILSEYGINYIQQYKIPIDTTINIQGNTEIDFYLPEYNIFIEYNGIQHYIPQDYFGGKLKFEKYQIPRDNYVRNYCKDNNIRLIEVDYTYKTKQDIINYLNTNAKEIFIRQKLN